MSTMHEPNAQQIKDEKLYRQMGMTDEEFERAVKMFRSHCQTTRRQVYFLQYGLNTVLIKVRNQF